MTFRGLQDIPKTHNLSKFRTDTPSGSGWKTSFCSFSEGGSVTEIQFVQSPFVQNEKIQVDMTSVSFLLYITKLHCLIKVVWCSVSPKNNNISNKHMYGYYIS